MKKCIKCNLEKDEVQFTKDRNICLICRNEQLKRYYKNNSEAVKEREKHYRKDNAEVLKERKKRYRSTEAGREREKQYRKDNAEAIKERKNRYRGNNLEKNMLMEARRRAKKKNLPFDIEEMDIIIPIICPVLGISIKTGVGKGTVQPNSPSLDRIIPEKGYVRGNIVVMSNKANTMKSNATLEEIIKLGEFAKKLLEETSKND